MSQTFIKRGFRQAKKLLLIQTSLLLLVATFGLCKEIKVAIALLSGGLAAILANIYFIYMAFSRAGARASKQVIRAFYFGEALKIVISAVFVAVAFLLLPGYEFYVLTGYILVVISQWLAPVIIKTY